MVLLALLCRIPAELVLKDTSSALFPSPASLYTSFVLKNLPFSMFSVYGFA